MDESSNCSDRAIHRRTDEATPPDVRRRQLFHWPAGIKEIFITFVDGKVSAKKLLPAEMRQKYCQWGAAPFPSGCARHGKHHLRRHGCVGHPQHLANIRKKRWNSSPLPTARTRSKSLPPMHCNLSPLKDESRNILRTIPNPYVDVYEKLAASPNAQRASAAFNWPQIADELTQAGNELICFKARPTADPYRISSAHAKRN